MPGKKFFHVSGYASKSAENAARIAGVLTAFHDLNAPEVVPEIIESAIALATFYLSEAARLSHAAIISAGIEKAEALRVWLLARWAHAEILPSEIVRHAPIRALRESPAAKAAIAMLSKHRWLEAFPEGQFIRGAVRTNAWRIVEKLSDV